MRLVHIGSTGIGSFTATGQLLSSLFSSQQSIKIIADISNLPAKEQIIPHFSLQSFYFPSSVSVDSTKLCQALEPYKPDFLLIRLDQSFSISNISFLKTCLNCKIVLSVMDFIGNDPDIIMAMQDANKTWFISDNLARAYTKFVPNLDYFVAANGVTSTWGRFDRFVYTKRRVLSIGFFGNLNRNQSHDAIMFLAQCIALINSPKRFHLNIYSRSALNQSVQQCLQNFLHDISLNDFVPSRQYRSTMHKHDILFFGYGTSPLVVDYIKYSVSNKLPEVLCSGIPSIGFGSLECHSIKLFQHFRPDYFVDGHNSSAAQHLGEILTSLYEDYRRHALAAREEAMNHTDLFLIEKARHVIAQQLQ